MERKLKDLGLEGYKFLLKSGMMWEIYPEATGNPSKDLITAMNDISGTSIEDDDWDDEDFDDRLPCGCCRCCGCSCDDYYEGEGYRD